jgi:hypothetical protein
MNRLSTSSKFSLQTYTRIGGLLYLIIIIAGMFGEVFVRNKLVISGDVTATATNIIASPMLWRIGISADLIMQICDLPLMLLFYLLLKPVNKNLALLNLLFNLIQTAVLVANKLNLLAAFFLLGNSDYLKAFSPEQLHTLAYLSIKLHDFGFAIGLIFFGFVCLIEGYLISKSGYLPKTLGFLMQAAGLCYLTNSFALLLAPQLATILFPVVLIPCFIAELSLALWLLIKGINIVKWEKHLALNQ